MCDFSSKECFCCCLTDCTFKSEYKHEYHKIPYRNYKDHFEVPVPCSRFVYPLELNERGNQLIPKYSKLSSTYRDDYQPCEIPSPRLQLPITHSHPNHQFVDIDVKNCGYEKYLDIYATTKALDHRAFSPREVNQDAITVWDWLNIPKVRGKNLPLEVPIQKRDLNDVSKINQPKRSDFVPNRGIITEYQDEFTYKSIAKPNFI